VSSNERRITKSQHIENSSSSSWFIESYNKSLTMLRDLRVEIYTNLLQISITTRIANSVKSHEVFSIISASLHHSLNTGFISFARKIEHCNNTSPRWTGAGAHKRLIQNYTCSETGVVLSSLFSPLHLTQLFKARESIQ